MVHKKLMAARIRLLNTKLQKTGLNKFAGYKYFELGDFLPDIQIIFYELGLCGVVSYDANYATLAITDTDDGTVIVIASPMAGAELKGAHPIQNLGAVETYQRRYLWMTAMEIVEHDAIDSYSHDVSRKVEESKEIPKAEPKVEAKAEPKKYIKGDKLPPEWAEPNPPWTIEIDAEDPVKWSKLLVDATNFNLDMAKSEDDVKDMYKVNRQHYDKVKAASPEIHAEIMDLFKEAKGKF
jgi:hypothetical protein